MEPDDASPSPLGLDATLTDAHLDAIAAHMTSRGAAMAPADVAEFLDQASTSARDRRRHLALLELAILVQAQSS